MLDIHSHILPEVDDGADSVDTALAMLDYAFRSGTEEIILTPHYAVPYRFDNPKKKTEVLFGQLQHIVQDAGIPIRMHLGCEYLYYGKEPFKQQFPEIATLNQTRHLLMEFFFDSESSLILEAADAVLSRGCIPVIAHPERFQAVQKQPALAEKLVKMGALLQMNKGSILGELEYFSAETVEILLSRHLITFVGSDAHNMNRRNPDMRGCFDMVSTEFGLEYAQQIFYENPKKLLMGSRENS